MSWTWEKVEKIVGKRWKIGESSKSWWARFHECFDGVEAQIILEECHEHQRNQYPETMDAEIEAVDREMNYGSEPNGIDIITFVHNYAAKRERVRFRIHVDRNRMIAYFGCPGTGEKLLIETDSKLGEYASWGKSAPVDLSHLQADDEHFLLKVAATVLGRVSE